MKSRQILILVVLMTIVWGAVTSDQDAWAASWQNPSRQTVPTRTPVPPPTSVPQEKDKPVPTLTPTPTSTPTLVAATPLAGPTLAGVVSPSNPTAFPGPLPSTLPPAGFALPAFPFGLVAAGALLGIAGWSFRQDRVR